MATRPRNVAGRDPAGKANLLGEIIETSRCARLYADSRAWTPLMYTVLVLGGVLITLSIVYFVHKNWDTDMVHAIYRKDADDIIDYLTKGEGSGQAYNRLADFIDRFGPRMTGSIALEESIDYLVQTMSEEQLDNVHKEPAENMPLWIRENETASLITPYKFKIPILGLGSSVPTPEQGITAEAIVVSSFDELEDNATAVRGKIVVFNQPWKGYSESSVYRSTGASRAARHGAVAVLIRSVASHSVYTLHTGQQIYADGVDKIPAACITVEDAEMLQRFQNEGKNITIHVVMHSHPNGTVLSHNTVAELTGTTYPNEIVLISAHLDSWDVGRGAMDDGGGVAICWQALTTLMALKKRPKRTIRAVFWTAEEQGLLGSKYYHEEHSRNGTNETIVFAFESDAGAFKPNGLQFSGNEAATKAMAELLRLLIPINASHLFPLDHAGDVEYWRQDGVPTAILQNDERLDHYFTYHHTDADTIATLTKEDLDYASALTTVLAFVIADMEQSLPMDEPKPLQ